MRDVFENDSTKVSLAEHDDVVETLPSDRRRPITDAHVFEALDDDLTVDRIAVADQIARSFMPPKCIRDLSSEPLRRRMRRHTERQDSPSMVTENDQHIEEAEADRRRHEQIHRRDAGRMVAQKSLLGLARRPSACGAQKSQCHCLLSRPHRAVGSCFWKKNERSRCFGGPGGGLQPVSGCGRPWCAEGHRSPSGNHVLQSTFQ
jgi:hypothetical protein